MAATPTVEFFYDCSSPWTYFAFTRIIPIMDELQLPIVWRPILVGGVFNAVNQELYTSRAAMFAGGADNRRLNYYVKDMQDWARLCAVRANMPVGHPINSVKAMRGAIFAQEQQLLVPYSRSVFQTYWDSDSPDISNDAVLAAICTQVGLDTEGFFNAINSQRYKDLLRHNTDELIARAGYGSPTIFINGDDMYFGNDRLPLVEFRLRTLLSGQ